MATRVDILDQFVGGDHVDLFAAVNDLPAGQTIAKAWLTAKVKATDLDDDAVLQKIVTTAVVEGEGHITDPGAGDGDGEVWFDLQPADTALLVKGYPYDVQVLTSEGKLYTSNYGKIRAKQQVTLAES